MKSFIFCTSCINSSESHAISRYEVWLKYHMSIKNKLGSNHIFIINDGTINEKVGFKVMKYNNLKTTNANVAFIEFDKKLGRITTNDFPGWSRSFLFSLEIAKKYNFDKIILIESDFLLLSDSIISHIESIDSGWTSLYSDFYDFPETGVQVICKDSFSLFESFNLDYKNLQKNNLYIEEILPFTSIVKDFNGDRLGEELILKSWMYHRKEITNLDYIGQVDFNSDITKLVLKLQNNAYLSPFL